MKKLMFVLVCLLLVSTAFALESGPSNKVGYVKITGIPGQTAFGLPFVFWDVPAGNIPTYGVESRKPSDIVGSQINPGSLSSADRIVEQGGLGSFAWRNSAAGNAWTGALETAAAAMAPGKAYFYANKTGANRILVLAGEADTTGVGIPSVVIAAPTNPAAPNNVPYSWRDPREVPRNQLNLLAAGFRGGTITTSDRVFEQGGSGRSFYYLTATSAWGGTLNNVVPGTGYWIQNKHVGLPAWNYQYMANGQQLSAPPSDNSGNAETQIIKAPVLNPTAKTSTATN